MSHDEVADHYASMMMCVWCMTRWWWCGHADVVEHTELCITERWRVILVTHKKSHLSYVVYIVTSCMSLSHKSITHRLLHVRLWILNNFRCLNCYRKLSIHFKLPDIWNFTQIIKKLIYLIKQYHRSSFS